MKAEPNGGQVILSSSLSPVLRSLNASIVSPGAGFEFTGLAGLLFRNLRIRVIKDLKNDILFVLHKEFQTTAQSSRLNCRSICDWGRISCCQSSFQVNPCWPKNFGCDRNLMYKQLYLYESSGDRKSILVNLAPKLFPTSMTMGKRAQTEHNRRSCLLPFHPRATQALQNIMVLHAASVTPEHIGRFCSKCSTYFINCCWFWK